MTCQDSAAASWRTAVGKSLKQSAALHLLSSVFRLSCCASCWRTQPCTKWSNCSNDRRKRLKTQHSLCSGHKINFNKRLHAVKPRSHCLGCGVSPHLEMVTWKL